MSSLRILHLFSNWKWTGPAEPAVLVAAVHAAAGHRVTFACGRPVAGCDNDVAREARARGLEPFEGLRLSKHRKLLSNLLDRGPLTRLVRDRAPEMLVVHQTNDHLLGADVIRRVRPRTPVIRVYYGGELPDATGASRRMFGRLTDGLVVFGEKLAEGFSDRFGVAPGRIRRTHPPVDLARFDPDTQALAPESLGLEPDGIVVGIVARIQRHRRFELLFEAFRRALAEAPELRLVIVGRGTHEEELARTPARAEPLRGKVALAGYRRGSDYVAILATLEASIFLVPGTDGTCRAAREAMAMGVPVVATRRGLLPDLVEDGVTGLLVDEDPDALAAALVRLARPDGFRRRLGDRARAAARRRFEPTVAAKAVLSLGRSIREESS